METLDSSSEDRSEESASPPAPPRRLKNFGLTAALSVTGTALVAVSFFALLSGDAGVAQPVATILGGAGVFGAGVLTFRAAHNSRLSAEKIATETLAHAERVAVAEKERGEQQLAQQRAQADADLQEQTRTALRTHEREVIRDLRSRYTATAAQLAHKSAAIRLAGVYALASLADDWQQQNEPDESQVCIDLLRAYLRTPNTLTPPLLAAELPDTGELEVRKTILLTLHRRRHATEPGPKSWRNFYCTVTGADLTNLRLGSADLSGANLSGADLSDATLRTANLRGTILSGTILSGVNLGGADLRDANLRGADLTNAMLHGAILRDVNLREADLSHALLDSASLNGTNLTDANLSGANLTDATLFCTILSGTNLTGVDLSGADLMGLVYDDTTIWPAGFDPPLSGH
ncbi:pentapeptide repeat-containing protein [Rhodococcus sp. APC 3903]|uniref:pentapeptide repeat-containing protein n=1 Tax=Rhodococcus sp. APC 3903 TaxID=3035193 RepID=UPI0025B3ABC6|nr:pentapeptide repeat-containing protein [Rhodococcus sp. APC 3903]MDN3460833.1 pentapeptide repeat-containing protein [Rhodococcus sp. APC 3903]